MLDISLYHGHMSGAQFRKFVNDKLVSSLLPFNGINLRSIVVKGKQFFYIRDANMNQLELSRYVFGHGFTEKNYYQNYSSRGLDNNFFLTQGGFPLPCHFYVHRHKFYMCK